MTKQDPSKQCPKCIADTQKLDLWIECHHDDPDFPFGPIPHWIKYIDQELIIGQWYIVTNGKESFAASWYGKNKWISQNTMPRNDITYYMEFPAPPND